MSSEEKTSPRALLTNAIRQEQVSANAMDEAVVALLGINRTDGMCLDIIERHGRITAGQLAAECGLTTGAITTLVDRLVRAGYVERVSDPNDRRKVMLVPTERSREIVQMIFGRMSIFGQALMGTMSPEQLDTVLNFLQVSTVMNTQLAGIVRAHVPAKSASYEERFEAAKRFNADKDGHINQLLSELEELALEKRKP